MPDTTDTYLNRFSVNMGTGIIFTLLYTAPHQFRGMKTIGTVFYVLNIALFLLFLGLSAARYCLYPWVFGRMVRHPVQSQFLGAFPIGLATIVSATALIAVPAFGRRGTWPGRCGGWTSPWRWAAASACRSPCFTCTCSAWTT